MVGDLRPGPEASSARRRAYEVVFGHETAPGRAFDVVLILAILASVGAVVLESVASIRADHGPLLRQLEWLFTVLFTVEYLLRLWCVSRAFGYARSFFGIIDLLAVLPTYLAVLFPGGQVLAVVRILRVLRVFRILKLAHFLGEANLLGRALRASSRKITVFLVTVITLVLIIGAIMYLVEGPESGFTSIPISMYWAIVTMTTVGYGDIAPQTVLGQLLASAVMIIGYGIIAVPTGIVTVEMAEAYRQGARERRSCEGCGLTGHDTDALYCRRCGKAL